MSNFFFKKQVDWSFFTDGFALKEVLYQFIHSTPGLDVKPGEKRILTFIIDNKIFHAQLVNINFDRKKYPTHKELIQIRYTEKSEICKYLRQIFASSFSEIVAKKAVAAKGTPITCDTPEHFCLYTTDKPDVFVGEAITAQDILTERPIIFREYEEIKWENYLNATDPNAGIISKEKTVKLRRLDRSIADGLKKLYQYRCQICGCSFTDQYDSHLIHAHHIEPFTKSLNNDPENIMILCPNHHGIVHDVLPEFDVKQKVMRYRNGLVEPLKINFHL